MSIWQQLWKVAREEAENSGGTPDGAFGEIGLFLHTVPKHSGYDQTPLRSVAFASTGGDGVHFSFLPRAGMEIDFDTDPVLMSVPLSREGNLVVGANLHDFLCLGCELGYFILEQLVYQPEQTLQRLETRSQDGEAEAARLLSELRTKLALKPWAQPRQRVEQLQALYPLISH